MPDEAKKSEPIKGKNLDFPRLVFGNWSKILYWGATILGAYYLYSIGVGLEILLGLVGVQLLQLALYYAVRRVSANDFAASVFTFSITLNVLLVSAALFASVVFQDLSELQEKFATQPILFAVLDENESLVYAMQVVNPLSPEGGSVTPLSEAEVSQLALALSVRGDLSSIQRENYKVVAFKEEFFQEAARASEGEGDQRALGVLAEISGLLDARDYGSALQAAGRLDSLMVDAPADERNAAESLKASLAQEDLEGANLWLGVLSRTLGVRALSSAVVSLPAEDLMNVFKSDDAGSTLNSALNTTSSGLSVLPSTQVKALALASVVRNALENHPSVLVEAFKGGGIEVAPETPTISFLRAFLPRNFQLRAA